MWFFSNNTRYELKILDFRQNKDSCYIKLLIDSGEFQYDLKMLFPAIHYQEKRAFIENFCHSTGEVSIFFQGLRQRYLIMNQYLDAKLITRIRDFKKEQPAETSKSIKSKIAGKIVDLYVQIGQKVKINQPLLLIEAMKMENLIKSTRDGKIKKINFSIGSLVESNTELIEFYDLEPCEIII